MQEVQEDSLKTIFEMRLKIKKHKYIIWNKGLWIGEDTPNEDLWNSGYRFYAKKILGVRVLVAYKEQ